MKLIEKFKKMHEADQALVVIAIMFMLITCFVAIPLALREQIKTTIYYDAEIFWISTEGDAYCITTEKETYKIKSDKITVMFQKDTNLHVKLRIDKNVYGEIINKEIIMYVDVKEWNKE